MAAVPLESDQERDLMARLEDVYALANAGALEAGAAILRDEALFISSNEALACDHPGLSRLRGEDHACATVPLHDAAGTVIGSANISFEDPREFSAGDRAELESVFAACAAAMEQALAREG